MAAGSSTTSMDGGLTLDPCLCPASKKTSERLHCAKILEALALLWVAAQKKSSQLRSDRRCECIPAAERNDLESRFTETAAQAVKCVVKMNRFQRPTGDAGSVGMTVAGLYASVYRLENQYNVDRQRYIKALASPEGRPNHGLLNCSVFSKRNKPEKTTEPTSVAQQETMKKRRLSEDNDVSENALRNSESAEGEQNVAGSSADGLLMLDPCLCPTSKTTSERLHFAKIMEALALLWVAAQKKSSQLRCDQRCSCIPTVQRYDLDRRFRDTAAQAVECVVKMNRSRNSSGDAEPAAMTVAGLYANVYRLENQYNVDRQSYIRALASPNYRPPNCVLFGCCKNFMRALYPNNNNNDSKL